MPRSRDRYATLSKFIIEEQRKLAVRRRSSPRWSTTSRPRASTSPSPSPRARSAGVARDDRQRQRPGRAAEAARRHRQRHHAAQLRVGRLSWPAWRRRRWRSRTRSRRSTRAAATCWCSTRSTARRTSTSTSPSARSSRCCARPRASPSPVAADFLQPGTRAGLRRLRDLRPGDDARAHAGHAACTASRSTPSIGAFILTHPDMRIPEDTQRVRRSTRRTQRFWEPPVQALRRRVPRRARSGRAARTSTCAGSRRWWPRCTAS